MKNQDDLIARLSQLHLDNEKRIEQNKIRIEQNEKRIELAEQKHEAFIQWLVRTDKKLDFLIRPWWKKLFGRP